MSFVKKYSTSRGAPWRSRFLACLAVAMLIAIGPAAANDWSRLVSRTSTIKLVAPVACDSWLWWSPPQYFFEVYKLTRSSSNSASYRTYYWPTADMKITDFYLREDRGAVRTVELSEQNTQQSPCAVLTELPTSDGRHPYYVPPISEKRGELETALMEALGATVLLLLLLIPGGVVGQYGIERPPLAMIAISLALYIGIFAAILAAVNIAYPWLRYQTALGYQAFFDNLARLYGHLLPLTREQVDFLLAGPPHPEELMLQAWPLWIAVGLAALWFLIMLPAIWRGTYWLLVPLPLEELHQAAFARGSPPTPEELLAAVLEASAGKSAWQHRMMQRKAEAFSQQLLAIARHL